MEAAELSRPGQGSADADALRRMLAETEARLQCVIDLSSDYYWEDDEEGRFTVFRHRDAHEPENHPERFIGKTPWAIGGDLVDTTWDDHLRVRRGRQPFLNVTTVHRQPGGQERYLSVSGTPRFDADGRFLGYRGIVRDVTALMRVERLLRVERSINRVLVQADDTESALTDAIRAICESEGWAAGQYWRVEDADERLRVHAAWSVDDPRVRHVMQEARALRCGPGIGLVGEVLRARAPLWVPNLRDDPRVLRRDLPDRTGWAGALLCPVLFRGRTIGVLDFNAVQMPEPDPPLAQVIDALGAQIGHFYERASASVRLRESEERYASTVELAAIGIAHVAPDGRFVHANRVLCRMLGYPLDELLTLSVQQVSHPDDIDVTAAEVAKLHAGETEAFKAEKRYLRRDGTPIWVRLTVAPKRAPDGRVLHHVSIVEDISDRKQAETRVQYLATHDEMTGLLNRAMFSQLLEHALEQARRHTRRLAVLFIDLDRFKIINDSMGHEAGDELLKVIAGRLKDTVRTSDVLARLGGDEFVVLVEALPEREAASIVARNILSAVMKPVEIHDQECRVTASIGIAAFPEDADDARTLMKHADLAMYLAKDEGKNNYHFFSASAGALSVERLVVETHLRRAIERDELSLHYQAKVSIGTGEIKGVEALLRWNSPELGMVPPGRVIPVAEESGLIVPIGRWAIKTACAQSAAWLREGLPPVCMAVNLSPRQFMDPQLLEHVADALASSGMPPELLELEVTESVVMHDVEAAVRKLAEIKALGVRLAIDDFGTGYSSLSQLKRFPIDTLKVDRSFIRDIPGDAEDGAITEAIIALGKSLSVTVVAEGVETAEQQRFLSRHACDEMQGFYFSRPAPPDAFAGLLRSHVAVPRR